MGGGAHFDAFANNLDIFAKDLERLNDERKHPFGVFHPRRLEVSVSSVRL